MDAKLIAAMIAAAAALVVALSTAIAQIWQIREKSRLDRKLADDARSKSASAASLQITQNAIRLGCVAIQGFQDELGVLIKAGSRSLLAAERRTQLLSARDELQRVYREQHPLLSFADRNALNVARDIAADAVLMLEFEGVWQSELLVLDAVSLRQLERASAMLSIRHQQLLSSAVMRLQREETELEQ